ncbi:hypothetical protein BJD12_12625 [Xanthomonas vesicatoria ATCC 35937]|nr:hypothetical protein BJD12_12625 [Xanthomonas vesicatoria ATCC 35937]
MGFFFGCRAGIVRWHRKPLGRSAASTEATRGDLVAKRWRQVALSNHAATPPTWQTGGDQ